MQIEPTGMPTDAATLAAAPAGDDFDDAVGYEAALPFLIADADLAEPEPARQ